MGISNKLPFVGGGDESDEGDDGAPGLEETDAEYEAEDLEDDGTEDHGEFDRERLDGRITDEIERLHQNYIASDEIKYPRQDMAQVGDDMVMSMYVSGWPQTAKNGFLERIFSDSLYKTDVSIHIEPRPQSRAKSELEDSIGELRAQLEEQQKNDSVSARDTQRDLNDAESMYDLVSGSGMPVFDTSMYLNNRAEDENELLDMLGDVKSMGEDEPAQLDMRVSRRRQRESILSASPLGLDEMGERTAMMGGAIAAMMPFSSSTLIEKTGVDYGVQPYNGSPVVVDRFARNKGYNMLTIGNIGSGKSFSTKLQLVRTLMKHDDVELVMLDPLEGFDGVNRALGGDKIRVSGDVGLNPMEIRETPEHIIEQAEREKESLDPFTNKLKDVIEFFRTFYSLRSGSMEGKQGVLEAAIKEAYEQKGITNNVRTHGNESPTIKDVLTALEEMSGDKTDKYAPTTDEEVMKRFREGAASLLVDLEPFREGGEFDNLAQPTEINVKDSRVSYLDLQDQEGRGGTGLMMQILFNAVYERAKETENRIIFVIDEARYIMKDAESLAFLEQAVRHSRHYNLSIQFVTQTVEEFFAQPEAEAIADNCAMTQLNQLPGLDEDLARDHFNLNDAQIDFVRSARPGSKELGFSEALLGVGDEGWMPIHIRASPREATVVDYNPREDDLSDIEAMGHTSDEAQTARIKEALGVAEVTEKNAGTPGTSMADKLAELPPLEEEMSTEEKQKAVEGRRKALEEYDREELLEIISRGEHGDLVERAEEPSDTGPSDDSPTFGSGAKMGHSAETPSSESRIYHLRIIAPPGDNEKSGMPVLDALEDAFSVLGTDPAEATLRAGEYSVGFDTIIGCAVSPREVKGALEDVHGVQSVTVIRIDDQIDLNRETAMMGKSGLDVNELLARFEQESTAANETFEQLQSEVEIADSFAEIEQEMEEIGFDELDDDEVSFESLFDDDEMELIEDEEETFFGEE